MSPEDMNFVKGEFAQKWSDARAQKTCAEEKLKKIWDDLREIAQLDPKTVSTALGSFTLPCGRTVPYPSYDEIKDTVVDRDQAIGQVREAHKKLGELGISLPLLD